MRRWNKYKLFVKSAYNKSKRGIKGSISLFLAIIVTPLLGLTCLMVESIRYQDVIEEINEISDTSALSTLANYDKFLKARFGFLAISQDSEVNEIYDNYFAKNSQLISNDFTLASTDVTGEYSLAEIKIMKQQILEYSEFCSAFEIAYNGLGVADLFNQLMQALKIDDLTKYSSGLSSSANLAKDIANIIKDIKDVITMTGKDGSYTKALNDYKDSYKSFDEDLQDYIKALNASSAEGSAIYDDESVDTAWKEFADDDYNWPYTSSKTDFYNKTNALATQVDSLGKKVTKIDTDAGKILKDIENLRKATTETGAASTNFDFVLSVGDNLKPIIDYISNSNYLTKNENSYAALIACRGKITGLTKSSYNHSSSYTDAGAEYYYAVPSALADIGNSFIETVATLEGMAGGEQSENELGLIDLVKSLCDIQGACDSNLDAVVGPAKNNPSFGFNDASTLLGTSAVVTFLDAISKFTMPDNIIDLLLGLVELVAAIAELILAITTWATAFLVNIARIVKSGIDGELGNNFLLTGYAAYNFTNRTNYKSPTTFTQYDYYNEIYRNVLHGSTTNATLSDDIKALKGILKEAYNDGADKEKSPCFKGAEVEYMLCGYKSEKVNQCGAFYNLMMLRMLLDFIPILCDSEVKTEASSAGPYAWIIYILIIVCEPIFDTFILVNGGEQYLIKKTIYLTPSGTAQLGKDLVKAIGPANALKGALDTYESKTSGKGSPKKDWEYHGLFLCKYTEHMWLLLFLSTDADVLMQRMQNLVVYESTAYYTHHEKEFDIDKTYTYVHSTVNYTINPMFDFSSLTDSSFSDSTIKSDRYIGY